MTRIFKGTIRTKELTQIVYYAMYLKDSIYIRCAGSGEERTSYQHPDCYWMMLK